MMRWNDVEVKYSLLLAGEPLNIEMIEQYLKDGIKVLWFGSEEDERILSDWFKDDCFLHIYHSSGDIRLTVIDGKTTEEGHSKLERLEEEAPDFNLKQYEIEHDGDNPLVVVQAGAGSGKTTVMIDRLLYLMHTNEDLRFSDVVMITFTNKATDQMREKLLEMLDLKFRTTKKIKYLKWIEDASQISISTIHSFFKRIINEIGPLLGYGTNLGTSSMVEAKKAILRDIIEQQYGSNDNRVQSVLGIPIHELEKLAMGFWEKVDNNGMSGYDVFSMDWGRAEGWKARRIQKSLRSIFEIVEEKYDVLKMESNAISVGDINHELNRVVDKPEIQEYIRSKYKYIFCDEFQDSDDIQIKTIALLDKIYNGNLFVVGDVKQSIYRFRGATDSAFDKLADFFSDGLVWEPYSLAKNYRTSKDILQEIDVFFREWSQKGYLKYRYEGQDNDVLIAQKTIPGIYRQIEVKDKDDTKDKFIKVIDDLLKKIGSEKKSIMVLARTNYQLQTVKVWCEEEGKACAIRKRGGFFKSAAVRDFCSLIEAIQFHSEPMYLFNFLRSAYCFKPINTEELALFSGSQSNILSYLTELISESLDWRETLDEFRKRPAMSVLLEVISTTKPAINYGVLQKKRYTIKGYTDEEGTKQAVLDAKQYEADLQKLIQILSDSFSGEFSSLPDICKYIRGRINTDKNEEPAELNDINEISCIQGSTVHGAKGLQFDFVLLPFMDAYFEKKNRSEILIDKDTSTSRGRVGWQYWKNENDNAHNELYESLRRDEAQEVICDETRLLYVAMTRAKEGLYCFTKQERNTETAKTWSDLLPEENDDANDL